jgi:hypothetical protein
MNHATFFLKPARIVDWGGGAFVLESSDQSDELFSGGLPLSLWHMLNI